MTPYGYVESARQGPLRTEGSPVPCPHIQSNRDFDGSTDGFQTVGVFRSALCRTTVGEFAAGYGLGVQSVTGGQPRPSRIPK